VKNAFLRGSASAPDGRAQADWKNDVGLSTGADQRENATQTSARI